jgi:hypothetical protein
MGHLPNGHQLFPFQTIYLDVRRIKYRNHEQLFPETQENMRIGHDRTHFEGALHFRGVDYMCLMDPDGVHTYYINRNIYISHISTS